MFRTCTHLPLPPEPPHAFRERPRTTTLTRANVHAVVPVRLFPRPARAPFPSPSGAFVTPPSHQVRSKRSLQLLSLYAIETDSSHAAVPLTAPAAPVAGKRRAGASAPSSEACTDAQGMREKLARNCAVLQASLQAAVAVVAAASSTAPISTFSAQVRSLSTHRRPWACAWARPMLRRGDGCSLLTRQNDTSGSSLGQSGL